MDYAQSLGCYKGSPFPRQEEGFGKTEARFALQLEEEGRSEARVEDSVEDSVEGEVLPGTEDTVPSQLMELEGNVNQGEEGNVNQEGESQTQVEGTGNQEEETAS